MKKRKETVRKRIKKLAEKHFPIYTLITTEWDDGDFRIVAQYGSGKYVDRPNGKQTFLHKIVFSTADNYPYKGWIVEQADWKYRDKDMRDTVAVDKIEQVKVRQIPEPSKNVQKIEEDVREITRSIPRKPEKFDRHSLSAEVEMLDTSLTRLAYDIRQRMEEY